MEKQKFIFGFLVILIISIILISGCVQESAKESIQDILAKAENVDPVQYEVVSTRFITMPQGDTTTVTTEIKVWQRIPYTRSESYMKSESDPAGTTTKMIVHPDAFYTYVASEDKYLEYKATERAMITMATQKPLEELSKKIRESETLKKLGTETIDGKLTTIIEFSVIDGETLITPKAWIWNEKGIPLKIESTTEMEDMVITTKTEYKNFVFEDIPDSVFEVPEDKIIERS